MENRELDYSELPEEAQHFVVVSKFVASAERDSLKIELLQKKVGYLRTMSDESLDVAINYIDQAQQKGHWPRMKHD